MANNELIIKPNYHGNGKRTFSLICCDMDNSPELCVLPTLEQAVSLVRYINGGNMSDKERETVHAALSTEYEMFKKKHKKPIKKAASSTNHRENAATQN